MEKIGSAMKYLPYPRAYMFLKSNYCNLYEWYKNSSLKIERRGIFLEESKKKV